MFIEFYFFYLIYLLDLRYNYSWCKHGVFRKKIFQSVIPKFFKNVPKKKGGERGQLQISGALRLKKKQGSQTSKIIFVVCFGHVLVLLNKPVLAGINNTKKNCLQMLNKNSTKRFANNNSSSTLTFFGFLNFVKPNIFLKIPFFNHFFTKNVLCE